MKDAAGGHDANTLEKFYTDENGNVTIVNTYAGGRGAWSVELIKPMPNVTYNVVVQVDGQQRTPRLSQGPHRVRSGRPCQPQRLSTTQSRLARRPRLRPRPRSTILLRIHR
ncbi:hypothetical protein [Paenarthrobacter nitroguajacolicus]